MSDENSQMLAGRTGVLIGATGGLGQVMARTFVDAGAQLFVHGRQNTSMLDELRTFAAEAAAADVRSFAEISDLFAKVGAWSDGSIDFIVYAAGVNPTAEPLGEITLDDWDETLSVNLTGAFYTLKASLPLLRKSASPKIVLLSSIFGVESAANRSAYGASKHGLVGLAQSLAREEGDRLHINVVCPGPVWGDNVRQIFQQHAHELGITVEEYVKQRVSRIPAGRFLEPEELARVVALYCSTLTDYVNGQVVRVTGGASE